MPARAAIHRAGLVPGPDRLTDRRVLVLASFAALMGSAARPRKRYRQIASAVGGDRRRRRADFCVGAGAAGCRRVHSEWLRTVTAPSSAGAFVQFLCTPFGTTSTWRDSGIW